MKLSTPWVDQTQDQFNVLAVRDNHPAVDTLNQVFGEHTFFVGEEGLHIVEETSAAQPESETHEVVKIASWTDDERTTLAPHEREPVGVVLLTGPDRTSH
jgi:hypothetical protein